MAGDGYEVVAGDLDDASGAFRPESRSAAQARARFLAVADLPDGAFGNLPGSAVMAAQYRAFVSQVSGDVAKISEALANGSATLSQNAANYRAADQAVVDYLRRLGVSGPAIMRLQEGR